MVTVMAQVSIVVLSYPDVTPQNARSFRLAAVKRNIRLHEWLPHRITVWCADGRAEALYEDAPQEPTVIIHRTIARLQGVAVPALRLWARRGTIVLNDPSAATLSRDKLATALVLTDAGVPTVPSLGFYPWESLAFSRLPDRSAVIKPAHGLQGRGVYFWPTRNEAEAAARAIRWGDDVDILSEHYLAQPAVGRTGHDLRAYVVDGSCVALARRKATGTDELRANLTLGAIATPLALDHPAAALAVAATGALGLDYAGVDMVETADGLLQVLEVDAWAGFAGLEAATSADISGRILDLAVRKLIGSGT
jgi:RimK family alpha-L-glutamate ligase